MGALFVYWYACKYGIRIMITLTARNIHIPKTFKKIINKNQVKLIHPRDHLAGIYKVGHG